MKNDIPALLSKKINNTEFNYLLYDGNGPTVVLVHATGFIPWLWHPVAKALSKEYRVIVPCLSSHRNPDKTDHSISWGLLSDDVYQLLTALGVEKPYLVGHSMGGAIVTLVHAYFSMPAEKMVLIEPIYLPEETYNITIPIEVHPMASKAIRRGNGWKDLSECREYLLSKPFFQTWDKEIFELYLSYGLVNSLNGGVELYCSPEKEAALFLGSSGKNPWPYLSDVRCPVLVLEGETSENKHFVDYKKITSMFKHGTYLEVPGTGHLIPMEQPGETFRIIDGFIKS